MEILIQVDDITRLKVDAIVNAANPTLLGGGGVDGAIHRAAGSNLRMECRSLSGCSTGDAKITGGHNLPATYVIHTVGPVWRGGDNEEASYLASCYRRCLEIAAQRTLRSIAFPAISTGVYGYPMKEACTVAIGVALAHKEANPETLTFVCFDEEAAAIYSQIYAELTAN